MYLIVLLVFQVFRGCRLSCISSGYERASLLADFFGFFAQVGMVVVFVQVLAYCPSSCTCHDVTWLFLGCVFSVVPASLAFVHAYFAALRVRKLFCKNTDEGGTQMTSTQAGSSLLANQYTAEGLV